MMERRTVIGGAVATRLGALFTPAAQQRSSSSDNDRDFQKVADAIDDLRRSLERQADVAAVAGSGFISTLRQAQHRHLASTQHYPAFIEVGVNVWEQVFDWHVKTLQRHDARQLADGRYAMTFMFTTLLLRPEQPPEYIGPPYDVVRP